MEKIKKIFNVIKKILKVLKNILIRSCIIFFIAILLFSIAIYSGLQEEFTETFKDKETLVANYGEQEEKIETQIEEQKEKNGEEYPIISMLQYAQYMNGVKTVITMNIELAICSVIIGIIVELFKYAEKLAKKLKDILKSKKRKDKNES